MEWNGKILTYSSNVQCTIKEEEEEEEKKV